MRWRVGAVLCLFAAYFGIGCRQPITPNIDRNQAPETWITAAPFDTITLKDENGIPTNLPIKPGRIPVRFHVHWAGSDQDGAVAGFYWAVVETLPRAPEGQFTVPNLPGPKPQDYHFTTKTDSFFIFTVAEDIVDRQHAFFIYAVDNQGKPDPTPARFIFTAEDNFPPIPIFEGCTCTGTLYKLQPDGSVLGQVVTRAITDTDSIGTVPRDTCPSGSALFFKWHALLQVPQTTVIGYRYKLDEVRFNEVGPEVTSAAYNTGVGADTFPPSVGKKIFVLRAVDQAFGTRDSTRRFIYNFSPDSWFSGPDINSPSLSTNAGGERFILQGQLPGGVSGSLLSVDSTQILPAVRPDRRTFFEVWKDTIYVRQEGDTVHMNSWVLFQGGGFDPDSKYGVIVSALAESLPGFPGGVVLKPGRANGSPSGFRSQVVLSLTPTSRPSITGVSNLYPLFDPNNVLSQGANRIGGYHPMIQAGRAFGVMYAVDGDGSQDRRIENPRDLMLKIENGTATPAEQALRSKVLFFEVNKPPYLVDSPTLRPSPARVDTFTSRTWDFNLVGADLDPHKPGNTPGGPDLTVVTLRRRIAIFGHDAQGEPTEYVEAAPHLNETAFQIQLPNSFAAGPCIVEVELCDCDQCEDVAGTGRCRIYRIPVYFQPSAPTRTSMDLSRPGSGDNASPGARR